MSEIAKGVDEVVDRGKALYHERLQHELEADHHGEYLVINVITGEYELDRDHLTASVRAARRFSDAPRYAMRIGYPTIGRIGARAMKWSR